VSVELVASTFAVSRRFSKSLKWLKRQITCLSTVLACALLPDILRSIAIWRVPRLRLFVLLVTVTCRWRWVWRTGGMILTGENRSNRWKPALSVTLSTTNLTWTDLRLKPGFHGFEVRNSFELYLRIHFVPHSKYSLYYKGLHVNVVREIISFIVGSTRNS
jgi:hypothetical protein